MNAWGLSFHQFPRQGKPTGIQTKSWQSNIAKKIQYATRGGIVKTEEDLSTNRALKPQWCAKEEGANFTQALTPQPIEIQSGSCEKFTPGHEWLLPWGCIILIRDVWVSAHEEVPADSDNYHNEQVWYDRHRPCQLSHDKFTPVPNQTLVWHTNKGPQSHMHTLELCKDKEDKWPNYLVFIQIAHYHKAAKDDGLGNYSLQTGVPWGQI